MRLGTPNVLSRTPRKKTTFVELSISLKHLEVPSKSGEISVMDWKARMLCMSMILEISAKAVPHSVTTTTPIRLPLKEMLKQ